MKSSLPPSLLDFVTMRQHIKVDLTLCFFGTYKMNVAMHAWALPVVPSTSRGGGGQEPYKTRAQ